MKPDPEVVELLEFDKILAALRERTRSSLGLERVTQIQFMVEPAAIQRRLAEVSELREILDHDEAFPLDALWDVRPHLQKAAVAETHLTPEELVQIAQTVSTARKVRRYLNERRDRLAMLWELGSGLQPFHDIEAEVELAIDSRSFEVKSSASTRLKRIRSRILDLQEEVRQRLQSLLKALAGKNVLQEEVITLREGRFVLPVKAEKRERVSGLVHDQSATGQTLFVEPFESVELNNRIRQLQAEERQEIIRILTALTDRIRHHSEGISVDVDLLAEFDAIHAKALLSRDLGAAEPQLAEARELDLIDSRHPLLLLRREKRDEVVPLDMRLPADLLTLVITGPNAGGKTVALKTVGLMVLMTQCGLHIPAHADSRIPVVDRIFADIGDTQSIEQDLSTFTSHMQRIQRILTEATEESLVLIDEVGAGTDPREGAALAVAILEDLHRRRSKTVVTTHLGELKAFAHDTPGVENGSMEFDSETLRPTYRFRLGLPGSSYAFAIARRQGLAEPVIRRAQDLLGAEKGRLDQLIAKFERKNQEIDRRLAELKSEQARLEKLVAEYEQRLAEVTERQRRAKMEAAEEAQRILQEANRAVEQAIREIREHQASREAIKAAKQRLEEERRSVEEALREAEVPEGPSAAEPGPLRPGDRVRLRHQTAVGEVLSEPDSEGRVLVQLGRVKIRVAMAELERVEDIRQPPAPAARSYVASKTDVLPEIDVRGMRVDEAISAVDKFLDDAYLAGWKEVRIIHGKGTGALRKALAEFLQSHPRVARQGAAAWNQGGIGVTVVEMSG